MAQSIVSILKSIAFVAARPIESAEDVAMTQHELARLTAQAEALRAELRGPDAWRLGDWITAIEARVFNLPSAPSRAADCINALVQVAEAGARGETLPRELRRY